MSITHTTGGYSIAAALLIALAILFYVVLYLILTPIKVSSAVMLHCSDYPSRQAILDAFHNGNKGLDGDKDGIPCENRK